jgi:hypothetical protein
MNLAQLRVAMLAWTVALVPTVALRAAPRDERSAAGLPELVRTRQQVFAIPFRLPAPRDADAAPRRVVMSVSTDLGITGEPAGEVTPAAGSFTYRAEMDGEYWFRIRTIDAQGRMRGGAGPDMRVLVDAAGPRIAARVWRGADGEIVCRYAATDDSLQVEALRVEYRTGSEPNWKPLAAEGILSRESPAHMVGEDIWWAGEKVESLTVRITIADRAGNQTVRQFTLEPTDPRVDQAALARELGIPPLPSSGAAPGSVVMGPFNPEPPLASAASASATGGGWPAETAAGWPAGSQSGSDVVPDASASGRVNRFVSRDPIAATGLPRESGQESLATAAASGGQALQYRGRPLQLSTSRRFAWEYEIQRRDVEDHPVRVELWSTRDGGITWQRAGIDTDGVSPIDVSLPAAGLYGFRLEITADAVNAEMAPPSGTPPETWVAVDDVPPEVDLEAVATRGPNGGTSIEIHYTTRDELLALGSVKISFSPHAAGPWSTIASGLDVEGSHRWQPDRAAPPRAFIRVEVRDVAGNTGHAVTPEPVTVSTPRATGYLRDLRELPTASGAGS